VTALLVSHDGARWLPAVLDALDRQTCRPDRVVAVDTGSSDGTLDLLHDRLGQYAVREAPARSSYGAAVSAGLRAAQSVEDEWVWLLHDDSAPAPEALERLLEAAADNPSADILGPKLREWPSLRRLLEVGVTLSGTGRRETGLERGEYDQGQHDRLHDVLAVNTAGMLVRRKVLEQLGFDERLPVFGNDIDFGWRAARTGHRALVVPDAVVFHVEAASRGLRRTAVTTKSFRRAQRRAALYTLLANCSGRALPFQVVRLFLGSLLRAFGLLLVRAPGEAWEELEALASVYVRPDAVVAARRRRRKAATVPARDVRHLLPPPWLPYRHGLDFVSDVATALVNQASDVSAARRSRAAASVETGPVPAEVQELPEDTGLVARLLTSPVAGVFALLVVLALVSCRGLLGSGMLSGGALLPAPGSAGDWWRGYLENWHRLGIGSASPAAPYLLPLAFVGTLLLGKAWLVVDLLFLLVVPLAAWGGFRFLRRLTGSMPMALWGGVVYGLLPVLSGAVREGRLGTVAAAVILPWLAHAALFLRPQESADRRWRAAWRTSLLLALLVAFVPAAWLMAVLVAVALLVPGLRGVPRSLRRSVWRTVLTPLGVSLVLLLPWSLLTWSHLGPASWLFEAGLPGPDLVHPLTRLDVLLDRPGAAGAPGWISWGLPLAAVAALLRPDTRSRVLGAWSVIVVALAVTAVLASGTFALGHSPTAAQPLFLGFPLLVAAAAGITAAALAGTGIRRRLAGASFGWRQPIGLVVVVVALLSPVVGLAWWAYTGNLGGPVDRRAPSDVPTYMTDEAAADPLHGVLEVRGSRRAGFQYLLLRSAGMRLGDDSLLPEAEQQQPLTDVVSRLATAPESTDIGALSRYGVEFIYMPPPADSQMVGNLDSVSGLTPASVVHRGAEAWELDTTPSGASLPEPTGGVRTLLLVVQGVALLTVLVLAAPTRKVRR
jgi:GT2 family glycosyltransferase